MKLTTAATVTAFVVAGNLPLGPWPSLSTNVALAQEAQPAGAPWGRTQAEKDALSTLQRAGYQVRDIQTTKAGVIAKAARDGRDVSLIVDSRGKIRELPGGQ
jgi:hypothetical protein